MATKRKCFNVPQYDASKTEEVEFLRKLEGSLNPNTYVASLINMDLLEWFFHQVKNDLACDIMSTVRIQQEDLARDRKFMDDFRRDIMAKDKIIQELNAQIDDMSSHIANLDEELGKSQMAVEGWVEQHYQDMAAHEKVVGEFEDKVIRLDNTITHLKAKLYDLMGGSNGQE